MSGLYTLALIVYSLLATFAPTVIERAHKIPALATLFSFRAWVILALAILLFLTLEGAFRVIAKRDKDQGDTLADLTKRLDEETKYRAILETGRANHQDETKKLQAQIESQHQITETLGKIFHEKSKEDKPDIYGKIKEVYLRHSNDGLLITLCVFLGNRGAGTTLQPFRLRYSDNNRDYEARQERVADYCVLRKIKKPLWPSFKKEEEYESLTDLSEDNLKPLERNRFREGWLRFRIPTLVVYDSFSGEVTLEVIDATDTVLPISIQHPWPQTGVIRLTSAVEAEWEEAVARSERKREEESAQ